MVRVPAAAWRSVYFGSEKSVLRTKRLSRLNGVSFLKNEKKNKMSFPYVDQVLSSGMPDFGPAASFQFGDPALDRGLRSRRGSRASRRSLMIAAKEHDRTWMWILGISLTIAVVAIVVYLVFAARRRKRDREELAAREAQGNNRDQGGAYDQSDVLRAREAAFAEAQRRRVTFAGDTAQGQAQQRQQPFGGQGGMMGGVVGATGVTGFAGDASSRSAVPRVIGDFSHQAPVLLQSGEQQNRTARGQYGGDMIDARYDSPSGGTGTGQRNSGGFGGEQAPPRPVPSAAGNAALDGDPLGGFDYYGGSGGAGFGVGGSPMQFVSLGDDTQHKLDATNGVALHGDDPLSPPKPASAQAATASAVREIPDMKSWERMCENEKFKGMLMVYSDNCGHCVDLKPKYEEAARVVSQIMPFYRMNAQAAMPMLQRLGVQGVPWVSAFRGDSFSAYNGDRSLNDIIQFARMSA